jgi:hypothetical protein
MNNYVEGEGLIFIKHECFKGIFQKYGNKEEKMRV